MNEVRGIILGLALAAVTIIVVLLLSPGSALIFLAVLLGLIAGVYVGFAVAGQRTSVIVAESAAATAFLVLATFAPPARHGIGLLAIGYLLHGAWDLAHHPGPMTGAPHWYAGACVAYDVVIGAFILLAFP